MIAPSLFCDPRVTTETLTPGHPAATSATRAPRRVLRPRFFLLLAVPAACQSLSAEVRYAPTALLSALASPSHSVWEPAQLARLPTVWKASPLSESRTHAAIIRPPRRSNRANAWRL